MDKAHFRVLPSIRRISWQAVARISYQLFFIAACCRGRTKAMTSREERVRRRLVIGALIGFSPLILFCGACYCGTVCAAHVCQACLGKCFPERFKPSSPAAQRKRDKREIERRSRHAPVPLPETRERALSPVGVCQNQRTSKRDRKKPATLPASSQAQSPLFSRLPKEVRLLIYEHALGSRDVWTHVMCKPKGLRHARCFDDEMRIGWQHACWGHCWPDGSFRGPSSRAPGKADRSLVALLQTSRLVYSEAIDILYTSNRFHIRQNRVLVYLSQSILPSRFHAIRHLHLTTVFALLHEQLSQLLRHQVFVDDWWGDWPPDDPCTWTRFCALVGSMRGLRVLRIELTLGLSVREPREVDDDLILFFLRPLTSVAVKDYAVMISAELKPSLLATLGQDVPFRLIGRSGYIQRKTVDW
ncbi:hypothetical protein BDY21DRAFT_347694 [Lineolata rhizophorae]|uniref:DUF7730 domain-containing protein n=1 Tax=Lineolata rhizophorae TaxID=578093 RepID=A0A6A6NY23_9PEZI|nr:hypothetical protein BDY21DRAFT_347694 [Lineolata rhizophorae]